LIRSYKIIGSHASRAVGSSLDLRPPLTAGWSIEYLRSRLPLADETRLFAVRKRQLLCYDAATGAELWSVDLRRQGAELHALWRDQLVFSTEARRVRVVAAESGEQTAEYRLPRPETPIVIDDRLIALASNSLYAADLRDGRLVWQTPLSIESGVTVACLYSASPTHVIVALSNGTVEGYSLESGKRVWRTRLSLPTSPNGEAPGEPTGWSFVFEDVVLLRLWSAWALALSIETGEIVWRHQFPRSISDAQLYGDRYYVCTTGPTYHVLEASTGRTVLETPLLDVPAKLQKLPVDALFPILVSETHVFGGVDPGIVVAFGRETGRYVWHCQPKSAGPFQRQTYFMSVDRRLYYAEMSGKLHCMEETGPA